MPHILAPALHPFIRPHEISSISCIQQREEKRSRSTLHRGKEHVTRFLVPSRCRRRVRLHPPAIGPASLHTIRSVSCKCPSWFLPTCLVDGFSRPSISLSPPLIAISSGVGRGSFAYRPDHVTCQIVVHPLPFPSSPLLSRPLSSRDYSPYLVRSSLSRSTFA